MSYSPFHPYFRFAAAAAANSFQSCPTLCNPRDGSLPGSPVPGILQARTLEWVAVSFSNAWKWKVKVNSLSRVWLLATPWTAAYQALPSWDFPGKSTGVGCHCLLWYSRYFKPNGGNLRDILKSCLPPPPQKINNQSLSIVMLYMCDFINLA